jgi:hypothetical protein
VFEAEKRPSRLRAGFIEKLLKGMSSLTSDPREGINT